MWYGSDCGAANYGCYGTYPYAYDRFTENNSGTKLITLGNPSAALGSALTSDNIYFNGTNANAANGGSRPKLYAPASWKGGSSYSHLDEIFNGTPNALMTWSLNPAETNYSPGPVTMGILQDMGWTTGVPPATSKIYLPLTVKSDPAPTGPTPGYWKSSGGSSEFYVSPDRANVLRFQIIVNLEGCGVYKVWEDTPAPISSNQFSFTGSLYASGTFDSVTAAHGTTGLSSLGPICGMNWTGGPWTWSTTWQNSSQPSMPVHSVGSETVEFVPTTGDGYIAIPDK
jgi:hypothetical protein